MPVKAALVTGGAGFIGSHVATELVKRGHCVVVLDDLSGGQRDNVPAGALFEEGSVLDSANIEHLFKKHRFESVFHLAAYAAEGLSHFIKRFNYENNLVGSVNLINASVNHGVRCFVFTSSIAVYGSSQMPATEDTLPRPEDSYGISKVAVEMELEATRRLFGLDYVVFRPHNVYGENQNIGDRYRNVVGIFMNQILQGKPMSIFGDGKQTRAFSYIADVAPHIAASVDVPAARNQVFNIGADTPCTLNDLAVAVAKAMGTAPRVVHLDERHEVKHAFSSHEKFASVFGRREAVLLEKGLARMAAWVKKAGARESRAFGALEIEKNLPLSWRSSKE
ncbi:MAG: UDP-glucose 4-epimerase [Omnitrophica bacterium RIFCSPHIGHO2_02_FULL_63_14]|nr:MAG: UDP-glucose 4-epimerase [Omnitrophica bacterium RIFCSPHIGHO2_02_FULL_63_14]